MTESVNSGLTLGFTRAETRAGRRLLVASAAVHVSPGMTISVIVCAHNEERYLAPCLHSLLAQSRVPDEILVINNASTDDTHAVAAAHSAACA